ncbi:MAG: hypothetical protein KF836_03970 [Fimbriimonadaceae bacterium]|nr:hypothetical protein [Fimbriimonadaceae bacterium]
MRSSKVPESFESRLSRGTRKEIGEADAVAQEVASEPLLISELLEVCKSTDDLTRMRAFDALEKAVRANRSLARQAGDTFLLGLAESIWEVRLQAVRGVGLVQWNDPKTAAKSVEPLLSDEAKFVQAWAIDTATRLAISEPELRDWAAKAIQSGLDSGIPSIAARCRKLAKELTKAESQ